MGCSKERPPNWEPGRARSRSRGRSWPPGPSWPLRARCGGRRSGAGTTTGGEQERLKSCGSEGGEGAEERARGWVLVLVGGGASLLPAGTRRPGHTWRVSSQGGVRPLRLPAPPRVSPTRSGRPSPPAPAGPRLRPAPPRPGERRQGRGPRDPSAPGAATEGRACAAGGPLLSASAAAAGQARPLLFRISSVPRAEIRRKNKGHSIGGLLIKHILLLIPGNGASQALNRNIIEKSTLRC